MITRLDVGGAQETAVRICAGLDRRRYEPILVAGSDAGSGGSLVDTAERQGVEVILVPDLVGPIRPHLDARAFRSLRALFAERRPAVVHTHSSKAGVLGRLAAFRAKVPAVVHTVHGWSFNAAQPAPVRLAYQSIERRLARRTDALVVVTNVDAEVGLRHGIGRPDTYRLIRSGIDLQSQRPSVDRSAVRAELGVHDDDFLVMTIGRLEQQKAPSTLLAAFGSLDGDASALVFVGDGSLRAAIEAEARRICPRRRVIVTGIRQDVDSLLRAADAFALTSCWEGLPRALIEAVAARVPVVVTDTGGVRDVVRDGETGLLVEVGDVAGTAAALRRIRDDPDAARTRAAAAFAMVEQFSAAEMVATSERLYDDLLAAIRPADRA